MPMHFNRRFKHEADCYKICSPSAGWRPETKDLQDQNRKNRNLLSRIIKRDEIWVYDCDQETKHQSSKTDMGQPIISTCKKGKGKIQEHVDSCVWQLGNYWQGIRSSRPKRESKVLQRIPKTSEKRYLGETPRQVAHSGLDYASRQCASPLGFVWPAVLNRKQHDDSAQSAYSADRALCALFLFTKLKILLQWRWSEDITEIQGKSQTLHDGNTKRDFQSYL